MKLYHGTPNPQLVLKDGLIPNKDRRFDASEVGYVYLTTNPTLARSYGTVLEVNVRDPEWIIQGGEDAPELMHPGRIPPHRIQLYDEPIESMEVEIKPIGEQLGRASADEAMPWLGEEVNMEEIRQ